MAASFDIRDWIGWGAERNDPAWKSKATSWFNELAKYSRETRADLDTEVAELDSHLTDFNDHLADAGWAASGVTFDRSVVTSGRASDNYSAIREVRLNGTRTTYDDGSNKVEYSDNGSNEIYRINRVNRRLEHHSGAQLNGLANYYSNWQNYPGYQAPRWWREPSGMVQWEGLTQRITSASGAPNAILLTSSSGRTSSGQNIHVCMGSAGATRVDSYTNGQLVTQASIPSSGWISLTGVRYMDVWR